MRWTADRLAAKTGWREARARQGEASTTDRRNVSAELTLAALLLREEGNDDNRVFCRSGAVRTVVTLREFRARWRRASSDLCDQNTRRRRFLRRRGRWIARNW